MTYYRFDIFLQLLFLVIAALINVDALSWLPTASHRKSIKKIKFFVIANNYIVGLHSLYFLQHLNSAYKFKISISTDYVRRHAMYEGKW